MLDKLKHIVVVMMGLPRGPAPGGATREPVRSPAELWSHVYKPEHLIAPHSAQGVVARRFQSPADGHVHIEVRLSPAQKRRSPDHRTHLPGAVRVVGRGMWRSLSEHRDSKEGGERAVDR
jgi:hypothetical protein